MSLRFLLLPLVFLFLSAPVVAKKNKSDYVDFKKRFSLVMPAGWKLAPLPGDTQGMAFRKDTGDAFALMRTSVAKVRLGQSVKSVVQNAMRPFEQEIGFSEQDSSKTTVGAFTAERRAFSVFANGDRNTVRSIEMVVLMAFGHVHTLHFETLDKHAKRFASDKDRFVASYVPRAGRKIYVPLVGVWTSNEGPALSLSEDHVFTLGNLRGSYLADEGSITMVLPEGNERYRYRFKSRALILDSDNLEGPLVYRRKGAAAFTSDVDKKRKKRKITRKDIVGRWRIVDGESSDPLVMTLAPSGAIAFGGLSGRWRFKRGLLTVRSTSGQSVTYSISRSSRGLLLSGGDLDQEMRMVRD